MKRAIPMLFIALVACGTADLGPNGTGLPYGTYTITRTFLNTSAPPASSGFR